MSIPAYSKPCLVPAPAAGSNAVYLAGISPSQESTLVAHIVDLTNINAPTANPFASQTNILVWSSSPPLACYSYPGHTSPTTAPFLVVQFGAFTTHFANIETSGVVGASTYFPKVAFNSPKNFAVNGAASGSDWVLAVTNTTVVGTNSYWAGIRFNATTLSSSNYNFRMSSSPTSNPLLTIGTYTVDSTRGMGYTTIFDYAGGAIMYNTTGSLSTINTPDEGIINLSNSVSVAMSGIALTANAIPVTMKDTAYILDQGSDGSTIVYYLQPGKSSALNTLAIKGQVPRFSNLLTATALDTRIVTYSSYNTLSPTFNSLDTIAGTWSGPGLINSTNGSGGTSPYSPGSGGSSPSSGNGTNTGGGDSKSSSIGAIVGGAVGGLVVIALVAFLFIRNRRQKNTVPVKPKPVDTNTNADTHHPDPSQHGSSMQMQLNYAEHQNYAQQQQQQQQPQLYDQQQQHLYQQQQQQEQQQQEFYQVSQQQHPYNHNQALSQQVYVPPQQQQAQQPQIFIGQQQHVYTPPTLIPQPRQPQAIQQEPSPVIYNHHNHAQSSSVQSVSVGSPANSNTLYSVSNSTTAAEYPTSPTTPITAPLTLSTQALHEIQQLYKPPPANPQYTPDTQK